MDKNVYKAMGGFARQTHATQRLPRLVIERPGTDGRIIAGFAEKMTQRRRGANTKRGKRGKRPSL
jgi:hypothetical protein